MKSFIFFSLLFLSQFIRGQNLVMNPSFEDTIPCNQVNYPPSFSCYPWFWATGGSVDYFSETNQCWAYSAPQSIFGFQYARTGVAYCGLGVWSRSQLIPHYREYLEGILMDTLKIGHTYCVSFYVVNANITRFFSSDIQLYFSADSAIDYTTNYVMNFTPQISNSNGIIYDTLNWTQISGTYIAGGGEKFITIGNFKDDNTIVLDSNTYANDPSVYFYIDDVSVVDCTVGINEIESYKNKISLMPNPAKDESVYKIFLNRNETGSMIVYSKLGVKLLNKQLVEGNNTVSIPLTELGAGVYFIQTYVNGKNTDIRKLVVVQ
ncbi:MAG TPA: T9SS type A sorting domain-containing protein [Bacteroidia bacterium]|nr:T9SS type A sorting domain-containing protein [Bacteroidia bacterium]